MFACIWICKGLQLCLFALMHRQGAMQALIMFEDSIYWKPGLQMSAKLFSGQIHWVGGWQNLCWKLPWNKHQWIKNQVHFPRKKNVAGILGSQVQLEKATDSWAERRAHGRSHGRLGGGAPPGSGDPGPGFLGFIGPTRKAIQDHQQSRRIRVNQRFTNKKNQKKRVNRDLFTADASCRFMQHFDVFFVCIIDGRHWLMFKRTLGVLLGMLKSVGLYHICIMCTWYTTQWTSLAFILLSDHRISWSWCRASPC